MLLKKRYRAGPRRLQFLVVVLMLGCLLVMGTMLHPLPQDLSRDPSAQAEKPSPQVGYQVDFGKPQDWVLETEEDSQEYYPLEGLAPFISLKEDELLVAVASPRDRRNQSQLRKGGGYRLVKRQGRKLEEGALARPASPWGPPLQGVPLTDSDTEDGELQLAKPGLDTYGFNEALSQQISLRRELPEVRNPLCLQEDYGDHLPTASVIICFHNEAWSTLLRTVHSVLDTAPRPFLKEIILVDDLSQQGHLKSALSDHVAQLEGVRLLRSNRRLGVIKGRMLGAARAAGDVLVFMDSHCECHKGWLEPLLSRIAGDRSRLVSPIIDVIDWKNFQYYHSTDLQRGVFDWELNFHWRPLPEHERKMRQSPISPIRSPVVPGGVLAIDRHYFQNTGAYDSLMSIWGSENLELSIRVWLCGGSVEIIPCSRVGHVYRNQPPNASPDQEAALKNKIRIVETWLGSFKDTFYQHSPKAFSLSQTEKQDCSERLQLQKRLGCRTFHWFLANLSPELYPSEHKPGFSGKLYNSGVGFCADYVSGEGLLGGLVTLSPCSDSRQQQHLEYTSKKQIRCGKSPKLCFDVNQEGQLTLQTCTEDTLSLQRQHWDVQENGMIVHILSGKCIEATESDHKKNLSLQLCDGKGNQVWRFDHIHTVDQR
ncbi:polypeptide N-acetylgalactosaminyltransferase 15 [Gracilinanus agilis]|uniref:polypeptide N-acetylgalactosaminyltransferase 15 n=1 Tax=Gracilinanus agilis TaxID=191870 RepID=UPI001CFF2167|nr:polypeptide N-acetylgalactosaminyltransferase 15 [Gracilinanus agilis]